MNRLCSATFEQLLAFSATFCTASNLEQLLSQQIVKNWPNHKKVFIKRFLLKLVKTNDVVRSYK